MEKTTGTSCADWEVAMRERENAQTSQQWFSEFEAVLQWGSDWVGLLQELEELCTRITPWDTNLNESYLQLIVDVEDRWNDVGWKYIDWESNQMWRAIRESLIQRRPDADDPQQWRADLKDFRQRFPPSAFEFAGWEVLQKRFVDWETPRPSHTDSPIQQQIQVLRKRLTDWEETQRGRDGPVEDLQQWRQDLEDLLEWRVDWEFVQRDYDAEYWRHVDGEVIQHDWDDYVDWRINWKAICIAGGEKSRVDWKDLQRWRGDLTDFGQRRPHMQDLAQWCAILKDFREELVGWDVPRQWRADWTSLLKTIGEWQGAPASDGNDNVCPHSPIRFVVGRDHPKFTGILTDG
jgi:hypothetical protein